MLILGVDTSGRHGSIALVECDAQSSQTVELVALEGGTFSAQLVPGIDALLQKHGLSKREIDGFAVVTGPGSFTGLRVGLAAIKGLADVLQKPIMAVSLLEAVALGAGKEGCSIAALDAGRGEVYVGTYEVQEGRATFVAEQVLSIADLAQEAAGKRVVTPDPKLAEELKERGTSAHRIEPPRADEIALLGYTKLKAGETVSPEALDATYIRRTEAEIKLSGRAR